VVESASHSGNRQPTLIFDGDCGFCTWAANFSRRRLPPGVRVVPWQLVDNPASVGLTPETITEAVWWIDAHERPHRGHRALAEAARAFGGVWWILGSIGRVQPLDPLGARMYAVLARNRFRLPGSTPACQVPVSTETRRRT
jgi:predicted DCC family thiol-disulfide oxidoreductase YuxK